MERKGGGEENKMRGSGGREMKHTEERKREAERGEKSSLTKQDEPVMKQQ